MTAGPTRRRLLQGAACGIALPPAIFGAARPAAAEDALAALVEGAKGEGAVLASQNVMQAESSTKAVAAAFRKKYGLADSFSVEFVIKQSGQMQKQVEDEIAAGKVSADILGVNVVAWLSSLAKRGKLMAFEAPEYQAYAAWDDKPGFNNRPFYVSDPVILCSIAWNTDLIKGNTFASWFDLLRPEYKGKITTVSGRLSGSMAVTYKGMRETPAIGDRFFEAFAKQEPVTAILTSNAVTQVISGEYPITIATASRPFAMWRQGAKNIAQSYPKEGVVALASAFTGLAAAPHPNAAKLMLDFLRGREAQQIMMDEEGIPSGRADVTSPNPTFAPKLADLKLIYVDQLGITPDEFRRLGENWRDLFGT